MKISNKKIANVKAVKKNIRITGKKAGAAKITVSAKGMKKCVIKVTVKPAANVTSPVPAATASAAPKASNVPAASASAPNPAGTTAAVPSKAPDSKPTDAVDEPKSWDEYLKAGLITVKDGILTSCSDTISGELVIPEGITEINDNAFRGCTKLTCLLYTSDAADD